MAADTVFLFQLGAGAWEEPTGAGRRPGGPLPVAATVKTTCAILQQRQVPGVPERRYRRERREAPDGLHAGDVRQ
jgi:hypothetical protein